MERFRCEDDSWLPACTGMVCTGVVGLKPVKWLLCVGKEWNQFFRCNGAASAVMRMLRWSAVVEVMVKLLIEPHL